MSMQMDMRCYQVDRSPIDDTLSQIAKDYKPGLLPWMKHHHPDRWAHLLELEAEINAATLAGNESGLKPALKAYRTFFSESLRMYGERAHV